MHHTLRLYSRYRERVLRYYIWQAQWTKIPVIGPLVRGVANLYGRTSHAGYLLTPAEAKALVRLSPGLFLGPCSCRETFHRCDHPLRAEVMLATHENPFVSSRLERYTPLTTGEAERVLDDCHAQGLIPAVIKCREDFYAICNCCPCACVPLRLKNEFGIGRALQRHPDIVGEFTAWLAGHARSEAPA
jgi:hypothetical protein